ncbi:HEXXH motif-containing protein [Asanoa ferruginea]|uniref:HEXXH motif-containing protein n=1 Tax=Asanoa ferruginea TaxID=53367 RepID=A0A3D9ZS14_9ACTN|nr:HEXXH motif domain-containing protein [Asanoa ferruginea]REF98773.1 HEXXH motif-containing protein [Asanoa ferruginea]GIF49514.1 HEXXH motif domain-containing protein [Asanoa ferruginea]
MTSTAVIELEQSLFDGLAAGGGGAAAIDALRAAQVNKHLQLIGFLLERWPGPASERDAVVEALDRARRSDPARFAEVIGKPLVGGWAAIAVRAALQGRPQWTDAAQLAALAMVAGAATGVDGEATIPVRDGHASVPGLGVALIDAYRAVLRVRDGRLKVHSDGVEVSARAEHEDARWLPVRRLTAADFALELDDVDPYRHGHHVPPALRLPSAEVATWQTLFAEAWDLLGRHLPEREVELRAGLRTLVPLVEDGLSARSATIRHAFGVFGLTRPPSAAEFAVTLVHEFQHSKLSAMLDLMPMSDASDKTRYFAPWRVDPRPLAGLLQGVYAFVGVADTWRALREVDALTDEAQRQFATARMQVHTGLTSIEQSPGLTPAGRALVGQLRLRTDSLLAEPVPPAIAHAAEEANARIRRQWTERNGADLN